MATSSNVALGALIVRRPTATGRGIPCLFLRQLLCSLLLLAPGAFGLGVNSSHIRHRHHLRHRRHNLDPADTADDSAQIASNEAQIAGDTADHIAHQAEDSLRIADAESEKLQEHVNGQVQGMLPDYLSGDDGTTSYLISSFPELRIVNYVRLPDLVWRPLIVSGIMSPKALVVDEERSRLYLSDTALCKIVWYQLITLPDKTLISDGRQHVAVNAVAVRNLALDLTGNLWFSGSSLPVPPVQPTDAIWKQPVIVIDQSSISGVPVDPVPIWTTAATASTAAPLVLDAYNIFYGNDLDGSKKGSVVKAGHSAGGGLTAMADNAAQTLCLAVTPTALFYGAEGSIYGVPKTKGDMGCGDANAQCPVISDLVKKPTAMLWDGDGTIYVADNGAGAIYSFASGSVSPHALDKVIDAGEVWGLDVFTSVKQQSSARRTASALLLALFLTPVMFAS